MDLSYELPHRIHTAKAYPIKSSNSSSIIIYGHESGVRIVWRGGRPFKSAGELSKNSKQANGTDNAVISLDSDDEGPAKADFEDKPEFDEHEEELDPSRPYPGILQDLDLYFGTDVLHLALLPTSILKSDGAKSRGLEVLKQKIVFAAACADNLVRLVTLPLTPPSPASKSRSDFRFQFTNANAGNGSWGETVRLLGGHQKPSDGVALTLDLAGNDAHDQGRTESKTSGPNVIIASHSREITGSLLLYRVPISSADVHFEPFQSIYLPSPAISISFHPSSSGQHSSRLLVADATGVCRIYDFKLLIKGAVPEEVSSESNTEQGTWLLSLYPGFQSNKSDTSTPPLHLGAHAGFGRKTVVDAKWVTGGKAILVLLNDGEWGVWDIEGAGPGASQGLLSRQGIKGGSLSEFSLTGFIEGSTKTRSSGPPQLSASKFAPMTPGTRKSTEPFGGRGPSGPLRGQISVLEVPSNSPTQPPEESIVFWLAESFYAIPSLSKYWAAHVRKDLGGGHIFNGTPAGRLIKLEGTDLQGERCSGIDQILHPSFSGLPSDILILGEHRYTILVPGQARSQFQPTNRLALVEKNPNGEELDIMDIDQALARMENGHRSRNGFSVKRDLLQ